jgi:hypothetical protein
MSISRQASNGDPALALITDGDQFALFASASKDFYRLSFKPDHLTASLRDEEAARFQADHATIVARYPHWTADQTLAQLWDQGGYSWLATGGD